MLLFQKGPIDLHQIKPKSRATVALCGVALAAVLAVPVTAAEGILDCTYLDITGDGFVADTLNGVEARYNLDGPTIYCAELIRRYYSQVYGLDIRCSDTDLLVMDNDDLYFEKTDQPKTGDVMLGSAEAREKEYNHWALVKHFEGDKLTVFEQNWRWNDQAGIDRVIEYPNDCYEIYTLKSHSNTPVKPLPGSPASASAWAESYLFQAAEAGFQLESDYSGAITRDEFCTLALDFLRANGADIGGSGAEGALAVGLVSDGDGSKVLSREEAACIVSRLTQRIGRAPLALPAALDSYTDAVQISHWAQDAVAQMTVSGLMNGLSSSFSPKAPLTREQAVTIMVRLKKLAESTTYRAARVPEGGLAAISASRYLPVPSLVRKAG